MKNENETGMESLRALVARFDNCREDFLDQFTVEQLLVLNRVWLACEWDFFPDQWSEKQVAAALAGIVPTWDERERPIEVDVPSIERTEPDAECTVCGEGFFSGEGHPTVAMCRRCWKAPKNAGAET